MTRTAAAQEHEAVAAQRTTLPGTSTWLWMCVGSATAYLALSNSLRGYLGFLWKAVLEVVERVL